MKLSDFDFNLPDELIAQEPSSERDRSRLMVVDRKSGEIEHRLFFEITDYLKSGDILVINDTKVIPARLVGKKGTGGKAEVFLLERVSSKEDVWECLIGVKRVKTGLVVTFNDSFSGEVVEELGDGRFNVRFHSDRPFKDVLEEVGQVPLPPYIKRVQSSEFRVQNYPIPSPTLPLKGWEFSPLHQGEGQGEGGVDKERYQTIFAEKKGAVAAPTAGLHFTEGLLKRIKDKGVEVVPITLHVGPGTFLPVKTERVEEHKMLPERYEISPDVAIKINKAKMEGRRVVAVGSTATRALEAAATLIHPLHQGFMPGWVEGKACPESRSILRQAQDERRRRGEGGVWGISAGAGKTSIFIYSPYKFKVVDLLITNFHLPKSTLIMLVSAFAGRELIFKAYREAIEQKYRFYSYGDAMMIL